MASTGNISFSKLKKYDGVWRVNWIGQVYSNSQPFKNPQFEVSFAEHDINGPYFRQLTQYEKNTITVRIGAAGLKVFRIGSLWESGKLIGKDTDALLDRMSLYLPLDDENMTLFEGGSLDPTSQEDKYILPPSEYALGRDNLGSHFVGLKEADDPYAIIIPCGEVFRYYYAVSSYVARELLSAPFSESIGKLIYEEKSGKKDSDSYVLILRKKLKLAFSRFIAPMVASNEGIRRTSGLYSSIVGGQINDTNFVKCLPPVAGKNQLQLSGVRFPHKNRHRFLALRINASTLNIPYENLYARLESDSKVEGVVPEEREDAWGYTTSPDALTNAEIEIDDEQGTLSGVEEISFEVDEAIIDPLDIKRAKKDETPYVNSGQLIHNQVGFDGYSTSGSTGGREGSAGVDIHGSNDSVSSDIPPYRFSDFFVILENVKKIIVNASVSIVNTGDRTAKGLDGEIYSLFPAMINHKFCKWSMPDLESKVRRQVVIGKLAYANKHFYMFEAQRLRPNEAFTLLLAWHQDRRQFTRDDLSWIVTDGALNNGTWINKENPRNFEKKRFRHSAERRNDPSKFARAICNKVREVC